MVTTTRNIIAGNTQHGIYSTGGTSNLTINDNYLGTDAAGNSDLHNGPGSGNCCYDAISFQGTVSNATIENNIINAYASGVEVWNGTATNLTIRDNHIGVGADGTSNLNDGVGIHIGGGGSGTHSGIMIDGNVISRQAREGIQLTSQVDGATLTGNFVGTNAAGTASIANGAEGIEIIGASNITIGDGTAAGRNIVSGNTHHGIYLETTTNVTVDNNYFGNYIAK